METAKSVTLSLVQVDKKTLTEQDLFFLYQIDKGWNKKLLRVFSAAPEQEAVYKSRLQEEIGVILKMQFASYFLIVQDMLLWCDQEKIRRGCGRGSVGGCLIAYLMDITKIDPIKYGLLFSRFLNADRISMPDIDNDIETDRRDEVKQYLCRRYGQERVASIGTFGTMQVRGAVKDVIRSLNIGGSKSEAFVLAEKVNNLVPDDANISFDDACKQSPEFKQLVWYPSEQELSEGWKKKIENGESPSKFWEIGLHLRKMEGMIRQTGTHAAGVVISPTRLDEILPMAVDKNNVVVTANSGKMVEDAGFLKIDVLGLNTLSIIEKTIRNIKKIRNFDLQGLPTEGVDVVYNETPTQFEQRIQDEPLHVQQASRAYFMLRQGRTAGIFQCESPVAQKLLKDLQANSIEDISAVLALNRPGPLKAGLVGEFGDRKFGKIPWELAHPLTEKVLGPTFGVLVYQEQCMQLAVDCADFTMVDADSLRKAIGKKQMELMVKYEKKFVEGCINKDKGFATQIKYQVLEEDSNGNPVKVEKTGSIALKLWNEIVFFASYGFNKSHSVGYAVLSYQTAFLKANYPAEFWAAQLSYESDQGKINRMIIEAKANGIKVLPVGVNTSELNYIPESTSSIRRSLGTLQSVGGTAIQEMVKHRPYSSIEGFIAACDSRKLNKRTIFALIAAGAFDEFGFTRKNLTEKYLHAKTAFDRYSKRRIDAFIKEAGANKKAIVSPTMEDLELLSEVDCTKVDPDKALFTDFSKIEVGKKLSQVALEQWRQIEPTVTPEEGETLQDAKKDAFKVVMAEWERQFAKVIIKGEWSYTFVENDQDKQEWSLVELIAQEKKVYGTAVSAHIFDKYSDIEARVSERFPTNYYTLDQDYKQLGNNFPLVAMVEVTGLDRQFPYKKDPTKFTRLFHVEDRFGSSEVTVFDKGYEDFMKDSRGIPIRVWKPGNILIVQIKTNFYNDRVSLVYDKCLKVVATSESLTQ